MSNKNKKAVIKRAATANAKVNQVDEKQLKINYIESVLRSLGQGIYMPHSIVNTRLQYFMYDYTNDTYTSISHDKVLSLQQQSQQVVIRFPTIIIIITATVVTTAAVSDEIP